MTPRSTIRSAKLYDQACQFMPGGVNSPVRAFKAVGGKPLFFTRAWGSRLMDADANEYVDFVSSWGAIILGHAHLAITQAVAAAAEMGTSYGAPHEGEIWLAEEILQRMPFLDLVRFVNSGTEASLAVIRLARAATGRNKVLKFSGNYHGAVDSLLAKAGSGVATLSVPDSAGVPMSTAGDTLVAPYNDAAATQALLDANPGQVAAIVVEGIAGNMGLVPPAPGFLPKLRSLCDQHGALLILDEVMTGFRVDPGGAMMRYGINPDLAIMGKVIGGGLPVGAYGGRRDLMEMIAPIGPVYQAGTLSGNPLAMAAGFAALGELDDRAYIRLESLGARLENGLRAAASAAGVPAQVQRVGSMISVFFADKPAVDFDSADKTDRALFARVFHGMLARGFYLPPSALESWFFTTHHTEEDMDRAAEAFESALRAAAA